MKGSEYPVGAVIASLRRDCCTTDFLCHLDIQSWCEVSANSYEKNTYNGCRKFPSLKTKIDGGLFVATSNTLAKGRIELVFNNFLGETMTFIDAIC